MDGSNAPKWSKSWFVDYSKCFFPRGHCRGVLSIVISSKELHIMYVAPNQRCSVISKQISIHAFHQNTNSVTIPTCGVLLRH